MRIADIFVSGVGTYVPDIVTVETAIENGWYEAAEAEKTGLTGAAVAGDVSAPEMAVVATRQALERAGQDPSGVDLLLWADAYHSGPDGWVPHAYLQRELVGGQCLAAGIRQGCNGVFGALELAAGYLLADTGRESALVVAADNLSSPQLDRWHALPGAIMGDAASALVLSRRPGFARLLSVTSTTIDRLEGLHRGNEPLYPPGVTTGARLDFTARFIEFTQAGGFGEDGALLFVATMDEVVGRALEEAGIGLDGVKRVAFNNGGRAMVEDRLKPLGVTPEQTTWELGRSLGHVGPSDQVVAFDRLLSSGDLVAGDHLLMVGLGPGVTIAAAVIQVVEDPSWVG
ncbi:ketoacyl-ACP synthase III family protein [Actinoplanes sp. NPDC049548]|uniref:ketoacyl-ACP synthase III family protein n=1 Tax=Actinoplanes sp. NPDC049548 TaxID=3155152 RepID=UPI00342AF4B7